MVPPSHPLDGDHHILVRPLEDLGSFEILFQIGLKSFYSPLQLVRFIEAEG